MADFEEESEYPEISGWLFKWTNYLRGYQKRWFVLSNGLLSYYRDEEEMYHTCRGTLSLQGAIVSASDASSITVTNGETYHIKARNEADVQRWLTAMELSRDIADAQTPSCSAPVGLTEPTLVDNMRNKLGSMQACNDLMRRQSRHLSRTLIESLTASPSIEGNKKVQDITDSTNIFRATTTRMMRACSEYLSLAEIHNLRCEEMAKGNIEERPNNSEVFVALQAHTREPTRNSSSDDECSEFYDCEDLKSSSSLMGTAGGLCSVQVYPVNVSPGARKRRTRIPSKPRVSANLWNAIKNCIGKDFARIPVPASWCEPLSMLQRLTEDYEYADMLDKASSLPDPGEQLAHVAGFAISSYSTTVNRVGKPFNPLLGETYECDRLDDLGWKSIAEQVSHHPPISAVHCKGKNWECWQEQSVAAKFRGTYMQIAPQGELHVKFNSGNHYTWNKVMTNVHNIIIGKLWIDHEGEMTVKCHTNGFICNITFLPQGVFGREGRKVKGTISDNKGVAQWRIDGSWDTKVGVERVKGSSSGRESGPTVVWQRNLLPDGYDKIYNFTIFACQLNEMEDGVAPTDSRYRPDQRLLEEGDWEKADKMKLFLEDRQREASKARIDKAEGKSNETCSLYEPLWFKKSKDPDTKTELFVFQGEYWNCKQKKDWSRCPAIF